MAAKRKRVRRPVVRPAARASQSDSGREAGPESGPESGPPELWTRAAWGVALLALGWVLYLGSRLPGRGPIAAYVFGPAVLSIAALAVLAWGALVSLRARERPLRVRFVGFALAAAVVGGVNQPFPFPTRHDGHPSSVRFELPVEGEWTVAWGGVGVDGNLMARATADRRYGLVLVRLGADGRTHAERPGGEPAQLVDYYAFDEPLLAAAAGRVVQVVDGRPDRRPGEEPSRSGAGAGEPGAGVAFGNHVVIRVAPDEYLFATHLKSGSIRVAVGDTVAAGQEIGRVGHSGHDPFFDEPHAAIHLQDTPEPFWGQAVPWSFVHYLADGRPPGSGGSDERGLPRGGIDDAGRFSGQRVQRSP